MNQKIIKALEDVKQAHERVKDAMLRRQMASKVYEEWCDLAREEANHYGSVKLQLGELLDHLLKDGEDLFKEKG